MPVWARPTAAAALTRLCRTGAYLPGAMSRDEWFHPNNMAKKSKRAPAKKTQAHPARKKRARKEQTPTRRGRTKRAHTKRPPAKRPNRRRAHHAKSHPTPALPDVVAQVANGLRKGGAQVAPRVLDTLSAALTFLTTTKSSTVNDVAAAAYLAAALKPDEARMAAQALGVSPDLIPILPADMVDYALTSVLGRQPRPQALVAATVLYCLHADAARAGNGARAKQLKETASTATLKGGSRNRTLAARLIAEMSKITISRRPAPATADHVFSISIDLVGSTDAKTRIMNLAGRNQQKINRLNEQIYREFCRIEKSLYEAAVSPHGAAPAIDPASFFTVKGIGDEIWILCNAPAAQVFQVGHSLIDAAVQVAANSVRFLATENEDDVSFDPAFDYGKIESIRSPIKMFIDLLSHASNLGRLRDERFVGAIPNLLQTYHRRPPTPLEIVTVSRRIGLSSFEPGGWWEFHEYRTDYIGHEVDRFFRTTKSATPGTVTIGDSMARAMGLRFKSTTEGIDAVCTNTDTPLMAGVPQDPLYARRRTFKKNELKGIGYAYDTFTLFAPRTLKSLYVAMKSDEDNQIPALPYHETEKQIAANVVDDLVVQILGS
jgi:hypothetical protein